MEVFFDPFSMFCLEQLLVLDRLVDILFTMAYLNAELHPVEMFPV